MRGRSFYRKYRKTYVVVVVVVIHTSRTNGPISWPSIRPHNICKYYRGWYGTIRQADD
jgi:hypothetical protein